MTDRQERALYRESFRQRIARPLRRALCPTPLLDADGYRRM